MRQKVSAHINCKIFRKVHLHAGRNGHPLIEPSGRHSRNTCLEVVRAGAPRPASAGFPARPSAPRRAQTAIPEVIAAALQCKNKEGSKSGTAAYVYAFADGSSGWVTGTSAPRPGRKMRCVNETRNKLEFELLDGPVM